jgi:hypothetical protein
MESIWMAIAPGGMSTRVLAMRGPNEVVLKAELSRSPSSHRAAQTLLEAIALWEGMPVRAVLVVDDHLDSFDSSMFREVFPDHGASPLYTIEWVPRGHRRRRRDVLGARAEFRDLERLVCAEVAR